MRYFKMMIAFAMLLLVMLFIGLTVSSPVFAVSMIAVAAIISPEIPPPQRVRAALKAARNLLNKTAATNFGNSSSGQVGFT